MSEEKAGKIADLNDRFRRRFNIPFCNEEPAVPGQIVTTRSILDLAPEVQVDIWETVRRFDAFTEDDVYGEHDFGAFRIAGAPEKIFWKIDHYADASCAFGSDDPADISRCFRVLTILLASDY